MDPEVADRLPEKVHLALRPSSAWSEEACLPGARACAVESWNVAAAVEAPLPVWRAGTTTRLRDAVTLPVEAGEIRDGNLTIGAGEGPAAGLGRKRSTPR